MDQSDSYEKINFSLNRRVVLLVFFIILYITGLNLNPPHLLEGNGYIILLNLLLAILLWIFRIFPYGISGVLVIILLYFLTDIDLSVLVSGFSAGSFFFLFSILLMGQAIEKEGLPRKLTSIIINHFKGDLKRVVFLTPVLIIFLPLTITSGVTRFFLLKPVYTNILNDFSIEKKSNLSRFIFTLISAGIPMSSVIILSGSVTTLMVSEFFREFGYDVTWLGWLLHMVIPVFFMILFLCIMLYIRYPFSEELKEEKNSRINGKKIRFSFKEKYILAVLAMMLILWVVGSFYSLKSAVPAMIGAVALFLPGVEICKIEDLKRINFNLLLFVGISISLANLILNNGVSEWFTGILINGIFPSPDVLNLFIPFFVFTLVILRLIFPSNVSFNAIIMPIILSLGVKIGYNPIYLGWITLILTSIHFFPYQTIIHIMSTEAGFLTGKDLVYTGFSYLLGIVIISLLMIHFYWPFVDRILGL